MTVAALYVETNGVYYGLPDVEPWDEARDARLYDGPWPVVAPPPNVTTTAVEPTIPPCPTCGMAGMAGVPHFCNPVAASG